MHRQASATNVAAEPLGQDKENTIEPSIRAKTPRTGLKLVEGGQRSGNVSPAASPSSKKMRILSHAGNAVGVPSPKAKGLRDITNSALKPKSVTIVTNTDALSPRLLAGRKRFLPSSHKVQTIAPPSKLQIMNTASELDFSSMPDELLPEVELAPAQPHDKVESSDEDFFEQFDFAYLTQLTATSFPGDLVKPFEASEFESDLSTLSIDALDEESDVKKPLAGKHFLE